MVIGVKIVVYTVYISVMVYTNTEVLIRHSEALTLSELLITDGSLLFENRFSVRSCK